VSLPGAKEAKKLAKRRRRRYRRDWQSPLPSRAAARELPKIAAVSPRNWTMPEPPREDDLLAQWRAGDEQAARQLFDRYVSQLLALARRRISQRIAGRVDAEDIVQSVFRTFFKRAREGQFHIEDPEDLCKLLARITVHKTLRQVAFHKRGKRDVGMEAGQGDEDHDHLMAVLASEPTPDETAVFLDELEHYLAKMTDEDRRILEMRMDGYSNVEIAGKLGITDRKIRRLMERIRGQAERAGLSP
jgi:RNA polymerase sigma-70 factor (ECF subfamily)